VRYQYGFAMTSQRIVSEHLLVYKAFKPQRWFERHFDTNTGKDVYQFGAGLKGPKNLWEGATRANALFLSMAVQLNSEALRPVFDWFVSRLVIFNEQAPLSPQVSIPPTCVASPIKISEYCGKIYLAGSGFMASRDVGYLDMDSVWKTHAHTFNQISLAALQMKEVNHDS
jgi:hypothetical protein